jgi:hypothetical protein
MTKRDLVNILRRRDPTATREQILSEVEQYAHGARAECPSMVGYDWTSLPEGASTKTKTKTKPVRLPTLTVGQLRKGLLGLRELNVPDDTPVCIHIDGRDGSIVAVPVRSMGMEYEPDLAFVLNLARKVATS